MSKELEALKRIKQAIAEHLHKQTGVSVEKHFEYLQNDTEIEVVTNALNELERLKKFKETFDNYELAKKQDFIAYENWLECEKELEALKKTPIADDVCKALSEYYGRKVVFRDNAFWYKTIIFNNEIWVREVSLKDLSKDNRGDLITMIGKFYESLEEMK